MRNRELGGYCGWGLRDQAASDDVGTLRSSSSQTSLGYESLRSSPEGGAARGPGSVTGSISPTQTYQSRPGSATNTPRFASWSRQQIYGLLSLREIWQQQQQEGPDQQERYAQLLAAQRKHSDSTNCSSPAPDSAADCSWPPPFLVKLSSTEYLVLGRFLEAGLEEKRLLLERRLGVGFALVSWFIL